MHICWAATFSVKCLSVEISSCLSVCLFFNFFLCLRLKEKQEKMMTVKYDMKKTKDCFLNAIIKSSTNVWPILHHLINNCSFVNKSRIVPFIPLGTDKFFVPFSKNISDDFDCNVVTLGVGNEIIMEKNMKKIYPKCNFYGADPFNESAQIYNKVGAVFVTAIDAVAGKRMLSTLKGNIMQISADPFNEYFK